MIPSFLQNRPFLPIATEHLTLRPVEEKDAEAMAILANDSRIAERLARLPHPYSLKDAYQFITYCQNGLMKGAFVNLAIIRTKDQRFMGMIGLEEDLGYWLGVEFWGQGFGKEAMKAFVQFCFFVLNRETLTASALVENTPSRKIFEGLGFSQTGTKESTSVFYEGTKPAISYEFLKQDFLEKYRAHERPLVWVVGAALINKEGRLLISERPEGKSLAGVWELPGGKMEQGESPEQALMRELKEELGIQVKEDDLESLTFASYRYDTFHMIIPLYLCQKWEGTPHGAEGQRLTWVNYPDLAHYPLPAADIMLAHRLADILKSRALWI